MPYPRLIIGLLLGACLGLIFPMLASWWMIIVVVIFFVANELVGRSGFGSHWAGYRFSSYLLNTGVIVCVAIGIFLGSGNIGRLLIAFGKLLS